MTTTTHTYPFNYRPCYTRAGWRVRLFTDEVPTKFFEDEVYGTESEARCRADENNYQYSLNGEIPSTHLVYLSDC
jgi:hypothetical protein